MFFFFFFIYVKDCERSVGMWCLNVYTFLNFYWILPLYVGRSHTHNCSHKHIATPNTHTRTKPQTNLFFSFSQSKAPIPIQHALPRQQFSPYRVREKKRKKRETKGKEVPPRRYFQPTLWGFRRGSYGGSLGVLRGPYTTSLSGLSVTAPKGVAEGREEAAKERIKKGNL